MSGGFTSPIIRADRLPRIILVRDIGLTLVMWFIMFLILETELKVGASFIRQLRGLPGAVVDLRLGQFWQHLKPSVMIVVALVALLALASLLTARRQSTARQQPLPPPVAIELLERFAGISLTEMQAATSLKVSVVRLDDVGRIQSVLERRRGR